MSNPWHNLTVKAYPSIYPGGRTILALSIARARLGQPLWRISACRTLLHMYTHFQKYILHPDKSLLLSFILIVSLGCQARIVWDGKVDEIPIGNRVEVLKDPKGTLGIEEVSNPSMAGQFRKSEKEILNFDFSGTVHWIRFSFQNPTSDTLLLVLAQAVLPVADLYFKNDSGQWQCYKAGYHINLNQKPVRHHFQIYPLSGGSKEYYIRLISFSPPVPISIWKARCYEIKAVNQKFYYGLYTGILMFVVLYNLFLFLSLGKLTHLQYSSIVFTYLLISASVMDGYILYFFPSADLTFTYTFFSAVSSVNIALYALLFLEIKTFVPGIFKFAVGVVIYFSVYLVSLFFLPYEVKVIANQLHALFVLSYIFFIGIKAGNKGNKMGYYFALAYFLYFAIVVIEIVYMQTGRPQYPFEVSHVSIAILIEAVVLTYLISKRLSWERQEIEWAKEEAQRLLLHKTKENEQIVRDQNIRLEQTVTERTQEILHQKAILEKTLTEKEGLLHEKEVLLKEIHHRVKNNLQTISSMLMLQSAGLKDEQAKKAIAESQNRVSSIALVHQKLYQTEGLEKVELSAFIRDLTEQVKSFYRGQSKNVTIELNIPETEIVIDAAVPLGLMLNELLTNSFKYAFTEPVTGSIKIDLMETGIDSAQKSKTFKLIYSDTGKGIASLELMDKSITMGLRLIKLLSQQIGATCDYTNNGISQFVFTFCINV